MEPFDAARSQDPSAHYYCTYGSSQRRDVLQYGILNAQYQSHQMLPRQHGTAGINFHVQFSNHLASQMTRFYDYFIREGEYQEAKAFENPAIWARARELGEPNDWNLAATERLRLTYETSNVPAGPLALRTLIDLSEYLQMHRLDTVQDTYVQPRFADAEWAANSLWSQYQYHHSSQLTEQRAEDERQQKLYEFQKRQAEEEAEFRKWAGWSSQTNTVKLRADAQEFKPSIPPTPSATSAKDPPKPDNDSGYMTQKGSSMNLECSDRLESSDAFPKVPKRTAESARSPQESSAQSSIDRPESMMERSPRQRSFKEIASPVTLGLRKASHDDFDLDICIYVTSSEAVVPARATFDTGNKSSSNLISYSWVIDNKLKGNIMPEEVEKLRGPGGETLKVIGYIVLGWRIRDRDEGWMQDRFRVVVMTSTQVLFCARFIIEKGLFYVSANSVNIAGPDHKISMTDRHRQNLLKEKQRQDKKQAEEDRQAREKDKERAKSQAKGKKGHKK